MDKKDLGLLFVFLGAAMWVQAFTYAALNTAFVYSFRNLSWKKLQFEKDCRRRRENKRFSRN